MIVNFTKPKAFRIHDAQALDPITVYLEDQEPGRGTLTVRCFDRAWTCYWGGMGDRSTLATFMAGVSAEYIANCLLRGNRGVITRREVEYREMAYLTRICEAIKGAISMGAAG